MTVIELLFRDFFKMEKPVSCELPQGLQLGSNQEVFQINKWSSLSSAWFSVCIAAWTVKCSDKKWQTPFCLLLLLISSKVFTTMIGSSEGHSTSSLQTYFHHSRSIECFSGLSPIPFSSSVGRAFPITQPAQMFCLLWVNYNFFRPTALSPPSAYYMPSSRTKAHYIIMNWPQYRLLIFHFHSCLCCSRRADLSLCRKYPLADKLLKLSLYTSSRSTIYFFLQDVYKAEDDALGILAPQKSA